MIQFLFKCFLLMTVLLFGVLFGMQVASDGMHAMRGEQADPPAFGWEADSGELHVLGSELSSHHLKEKQEKLEEIGAFNFFSEIGHTLAEIIKNIVKTCISYVTSIIDKWVVSILD